GSLLSAADGRDDGYFGVIRNNCLVRGKILADGNRAPRQEVTELRTRGGDPSAQFGDGYFGRQVQPQHITTGKIAGAGEEANRNGHGERYRFSGLRRRCSISGIRP